MQGFSMLKQVVQIVTTGFKELMSRSSTLCTQNPIITSNIEIKIQNSGIKIFFMKITYDRNWCGIISTTSIHSVHTHNLTQHHYYLLYGAMFNIFVDALIYCHASTLCNVTSNPNLYHISVCGCSQKLNPFGKISASWHYIRKVSGSYTGTDTDYSEVFSWLSSVQPGKFRDITSNQATTASFHVLSNSSINQSINQSITLPFEAINLRYWQCC
jgi:hypothetical protein